MGRLATVMLVLVGLTPLAASGQGIQGRGIEAWAGYYAWSGADVESVDPGFNLGVAVLAETAPHFGFGVEVRYGRYEGSGTAFDELGLNAVFRYSLGPRSGLHAFLQGRAGWSRLSASSLTQDGLAAGPELGVEVPLGGRVHLVLAGGGTWRNYEAARLGGGLALTLGDGATGFVYGARAGLSLIEIF